MHAYAYLGSKDLTGRASRLLVLHPALPCLESDGSISKENGS